MVILINPFTVFDGREKDFLTLWDQTNAIFKAAPGYISARLCEASDKQAIGQKPPYTHINIAEWESAEKYWAVLQDEELRKFAALYREVCTFNPAIYQIVRG